jgi:hypothetical protein
MPVIRLTPIGSNFKVADREALTTQLVKELAGDATEKGPVIFEIPLSGGDRFDSLVVWEKWKDKNVPAQTRSEIILAAYGEKKDKIALPLGVTYQEAMEQNLLPYAVVPMMRKNEISAESLKTAVQKCGGFILEKGKTELRFPTMEMAKEAHQRLVDELPKGYWSIVQNAT